MRSAAASRWLPGQVKGWRGRGGAGGGAARTCGRGSPGHGGCAGGARPPPPLTPGRLPSIRSRDLTLGGVKKKTFTPNIISRKIKEEDVTVKKEKKERDRDRQRDGHGRGRGRPEVIQSHSIFEQGPAEMMKKKAGGLPSPGCPSPEEEKMELDPPAVKVKEEPCDEDPPAKPAQTKGPPGFPRDVSVARAAAAAELVGGGGAALPAAARHAARAAAHPGHQTHQNGAAKRGRTNGRGEAGEEPGGEAGGEYLHPGRPPRGAGGETAHPQVGEGTAGAGQGDPGCDPWGTPCSFLQELVSVSVGDNRTGEMIVLGHVKHKLVCSPDFEALLEHRHR
ncbi:unnamed protein product [Bubo scandiacus]